MIAPVPLSRARLDADEQTFRTGVRMCVLGLSSYAGPYVVREHDDSLADVDWRTRPGHVAHVCPEPDSVLVEVEGWRGTLRQFFADNAEGFDCGERREIIKALREDGEYRGGGGAAGEFVVRLVDPDGPFFLSGSGGGWSDGYRHGERRGSLAETIAEARRMAGAYQFRSCSLETRRDGRTSTVWTLQDGRRL